MDRFSREARLVRKFEELKALGVGHTPAVRIKGRSDVVSVEYAPAYPGGMWKLSDGTYTSTRQIIELNRARELTGYE